MNEKGSYTKIVHSREVREEALNTIIDSMWEDGGVLIQLTFPYGMTQAVMVFAFPDRDAA